jgi:hypothetical protein
MTDQPKTAPQAHENGAGNQLKRSNDVKQAAPASSPQPQHKPIETKKT